MLKADKLNRASGSSEEIKFVLKRKELMEMITAPLKSGDIPLRVTHNDTKLNNVLLDDKTCRGRCVIDLDTVMPGSLLYDFGDMVRSAATTALEDEEDLSKVSFLVERFKSLASGFLQEAGSSMTAEELRLLPYAGIVMTLECGMRFLTDYLDGDNYFKVHKPNHNLIRAKTQFKLVADMEKNLGKLICITK